MPKKRLKHRQLLKKLKQFGIIEDKRRGKGSERMLILDKGFDEKYQGPQIPIKYHGENTEYSPKITDAILFTFGIDPNEFWKD